MTDFAPFIGEATWLSLKVALWSTLVTVPLALIAATSFHRSRWRFVEAFFLLPLFLPATVTGFFLLWLFSPRHQVGASLEKLFGQIIFTPTATILACAFVSFPLAYQTVMVGLSRIRTEQMESAVMLGGAGVLNTVRILWPLCRGAMLVAALLVFARSLGEFGASVMVGGNVPSETQTLPLAVYSLAEGGEFSAAMLATGCSVVLGFMLYVALRLAEKRA